MLPADRGGPVVHVRAVGGRFDRRRRRRKNKEGFLKSQNCSRCATGERPDWRYGHRRVILLPQARVLGQAPRGPAQNDGFALV